jgi:predicted dehydrogenase
MKKKFKWGIVGTGGIANAFAHDLQYLNNHVVESVLSRDMKTAKKFSSNYKGCKPFNKEKLFFKNKDIDAVYIATPNTLHAKQSIESLQNRIPVLCEKPFSMNLQETQNMVLASKKNNTALLEAMWMRYLPHIDFLKKILKDDPIGKVHSLYACHGQNLKGVKNPRLWTKELGGGALLDLGIYVVSLSQMIFGTPKNIQAKSIFTKEGIDAKTSMIFEYNNGEIANLNCTMYDSHPNRAVISGEEGWIEIDPTFYAPTTIRVINRNQKKITYEENYHGHGLREQALEMQNCILNNNIESKKMTHSDSISVMEIMDNVRYKVGLKY